MSGSFCCRPPVSLVVVDSPRCAGTQLISGAVVKAMECRRAALDPILNSVPSLHLLLEHPFDEGSSADVILTKLGAAAGDAWRRLRQAGKAFGEIDLQNTDPAKWHDKTVARDRALQDVVHLLTLQITGFEVRVDGVRRVVLSWSRFRPPPLPPLHWHRCARTV